MYILAISKNCNIVTCGHMILLLILNLSTWFIFAINIQLKQLYYRLLAESSIWVLNAHGHFIKEFLHILLCVWQSLNHFISLHKVLFTFNWLSIILTQNVKCYLYINTCITGLPDQIYFCFSYEKNMYFSLDATITKLYCITA